MMIVNKINEFYGNRGFIFDFLISSITISILWFSNFPLNFLQQMSDSRFESVISFFGILVGFLLTTFSLLFLYNPEQSKELMKLRQHPAYKRMLYSFISTSFFTIILTVSFLITDFLPYYKLIFLLMIFVLLRILKCLYYLYVIISLS